MCNDETLIHCRPQQPPAMTDHCGFYWVIKGQLAGAAYPADCLDWLYHQQGIRALLSLESLTSADAQHAQRLGLQVRIIPITDFTAGTPEQRTLALATIDQFLEQGLPTLVHCKGGLGRTGMILALFLVRRKGVPPDLAIKRIRRLKPGSIEKSTGQLEAIREAAK